MSGKTRNERKSAKVAAALTNGAMAAPPVVKKETILEDHLPPLALVLTIFLCSGILWVFGLRDLLATGKSLLGPVDDSYLVSLPLC